MSRSAPPDDWRCLVIMSLFLLIMSDLQVVHIFECVCGRARRYAHVSMRVCIYVCACLRVNVRMHVHMCMCVCESRGTPALIGHPHRFINLRRPRLRHIFVLVMAEL